MAGKSEQLQIRVTPAQKKALKSLARKADLDLSSYVLLRALPPASVRFAEILQALRYERGNRFELAVLNDFLAELPAAGFRDAVAVAQIGELSPLLQNYVAAMTEQAAHHKRQSPPAWTRDVAPLEEPWFAVQFRRLRPYLLRVTPVPFKRRNLFADSTVGDRV